jgi:hypothetical protein
MTDPEGKAAMTEIAQKYEELAKRALLRIAAERSSYPTATQTREPGSA